MTVLGQGTPTHRELRWRRVLLGERSQQSTARRGEEFTAPTSTPQAQQVQYASQTKHLQGIHRKTRVAMTLCRGTDLEIRLLIAKFGWSPIYLSSSCPFECNMVGK